MEKLKKMKLTTVIPVAIIATVIIALLIKGATSSSSTKRHRSDGLLQTWNYVNEQFSKVIETIGDKSYAEVELRVISMDNNGYPKRYEFVGLKDGREFLVYDEDGELKE